MKRHLQLPIKAPGHGYVLLTFDKDGITYTLHNKGGDVIHEYGYDEYSDLDLKATDKWNLKKIK